jgi:diadenosine tetraphosphatase ApaH/serine/threonine PP2A family protein phosphatase
MRYAIFSDIHANLEALEAVLAKIDEIAEKEPIDAIWFLGDLVGYGPNPNECIIKLRERTDVIIAGNHDWAAVGKIDLEDFSAAARISAEWTAEQLTEDHREFLIHLPERLEKGECTLVHGSPYGPLWEYLTSEVLAERSFQHFSTRYCFVGHTHVPVIFQQLDPVENVPTLPLGHTEQTNPPSFQSNGLEDSSDEREDDTDKMVAVHPPAHISAATQSGKPIESAYKDPETGATLTEGEADAIIEEKLQATDQPSTGEIAAGEGSNATSSQDISDELKENDAPEGGSEHEDIPPSPDRAEDEDSPDDGESGQIADGEGPHDANSESEVEGLELAGEKTPIAHIADAEDRLNAEIEELLTLLGLTQSMITVTNEMLTPPEGHWEAPEEYRAIINPGGVGQPRDGDPRAAFMIYDTERGFEFYRVAYPFEKTQEKILKAGLPHYLAIRLAYGR